MTRGRRAILGATVAVLSDGPTGRTGLTGPTFGEIPQDQRAVDRVMAAAMETAPARFAPLLTAISQVVSDASDMSDLSDLLPRLYLERGTRAGLAGHLTTALLAAGRIGEASVRQTVGRVGPVGPVRPGPQFIEVDYGPGRPFTGASDFFRAQGFTIAGVSHADLLGAVKTELLRAMDEGTTLEQFRRDLPGLFDRYGVTPPSSHRIETIYRTNLQRAFGGAKYQQLTDPDVVAGLPNWRYVAVLDKATRPSHRALHGKIWPATDPIWRTIYPPWDFNCRCSVQPVSAAELGMRGWSVESGPPDVDLSSGFGPRGAKVEQLLAQPEGGIRWRARESQVSNWRAEGRPAEEDVSAELIPWAPGLLPRLDDYVAQGLSRSGALSTIEADYKRLLGIPPREAAGVLRDALDETVTVDLAALAHLMRAAGGRERYLGFLRPTLEAPYEMWLTEYADAAGGVKLRKRYVGIYADPERPRNLVVIAEQGPFGLLWDALPARPGTLDRLREGTLLYGRA